MPTVAELDIQIDAEDNATAVLAEVDALIKSMAGEDVGIDVDAATADAIRNLQSVSDLIDHIN